MTGDSTNAPIDSKIRGPYVWSGQTRLGQRSLPANVGEDYRFPWMSNDVLPTTQDCGDRDKGGRRLGACAWWTTACDTAFQQFLNYATNAVKNLEDRVSAKPGSAAWNQPCTIEALFQHAMAQINTNVGSTDIKTGREYPPRGYPGFVDRRESRIFGGGPSKSGIRGYCDGSVDARFYSGDAASRLKSFDLTYPVVDGNEGCQLGGSGSGSMWPYRRVYVARGANEADGTEAEKVNSDQVIMAAGNAEYCRARLPARYLGSAADYGAKVWIPFAWPYGNRQAYPLEYYDTEFANLRQRCLSAITAYLKKNPAVVKLGGVEAACDAGLAAVQETMAALSPEASPQTEGTQPPPPAKPDDSKTDKGRAPTGLNWGLVALAGAAAIFVLRGK
jgi:hypothetical protein